MLPTPLNKLQSQIQQALQRSGRPNHSVRLIGVSKKQRLEKILPVLQAGLTDLGENYVQEWQSKAQALQDWKNLRWHFIGHLQTNKVKAVVGKVELIHTVDRFKLAQKISERAAELGMVQKVLLEVNLGAEATKFGFSPHEVLKTLPQLAKLPNLSWEGFMAIPPPVATPEAARPFFEKLKSLLDECNQTGVLKQPMQELSMGMSHDFEVAIESGATMVRIGTALFGPRSETSLG